MKNNLLRLTLRSINFYRRDYFYQLIIITILGAVITGSLLTGDSVRKSLKKNSLEKLGNADILISSGLRYFDYGISARIKDSYNIPNCAILETEGYCQNFSTGLASLNVNIYGVTNDFFEFQGIKGIKIQSGSVAINARMAEHLSVKTGDEIIIRFREADPLPANAPFAPKEGSEGSRVMKVAAILGSGDAGNFSLGINQVIPHNLFMDISDLQKNDSGSTKANRIIFNAGNILSTDSIDRILKKILLPSDIGLSMRRSQNTNELEIISDRIFIDSVLVKTILSKLPNGYQVITYLANSIKYGTTETPYSFISGTNSIDPGLLKDDELIVNEWIAGDLGITSGDTLNLSWFELTGRNLNVRQQDFVVNKVVPIEGRFADQALMPEFPGISGRTSCSSWDAGIPILLDKIRDKDEDYWNKHKGTPKLFVNYETGRRLWGNIFGNATAIRFPENTDEKEVLGALSGALDPADAGFSFVNLRGSAEEAASQSVDFSSLFLSLGFFILVSCILLLSFSISSFFDSKAEQIITYHSLGFSKLLIFRILSSEILPVLATGSLLGALSGFLVNILIVKALNTVWTGAVQTDTITSGFSLISLLAGFSSTLFTSLVIGSIKLRSFLSMISVSVRDEISFPSAGKNLLAISIFLPVAVITSLLTLLGSDPGIILSFISGTLIFITLILVLRYFYIISNKNRKGLFDISGRYYSVYPSQIVTPVTFIAAGIFAVIITGANRLSISEEMLENNGGTGGYELWAETAIPVKTDINTPEGKLEFGFDDPVFTGTEFFQASRLNGDDASCLNLNHIKVPPIIGIDQDRLAERKSFSFAGVNKNAGSENPWKILNENPGDNTIYGIADQTVLKWGLKLNTGDTLILKAESGKPLNIIIAAGLNSSVFQGNLLISAVNLGTYFPSIAGNSLYLIDCDTSKAEEIKGIMADRLSAYGMSVESASERLASFFVVTNTYLNVFTVLGVFGLILGVIGLGFVLLRNFNQRKKEFALLSASGYTSVQLKRYLLKHQIIVLIFGILTGVSSALIATFPSLKSGNGLSLSVLILIIALIFVTGITILLLSVERVNKTDLIRQLRKD